MGNWKDIKGYEGLYQISDEGEVLSLPRTRASWYRTCKMKPRILKPGLRGKGDLKYQFVVLESNGKTEHFAVHRLVAEAFLENPDGLPEVNHKDENPLNNRADNLEWCTHQYNIDYSKSKTVKQFTKDGKQVGEYISSRRAAEATGIGRSSISNALVGISKTAGGFVWTY